MTNESNQAALARSIKLAQEGFSPIAAREAASYLGALYKIYFEEYLKAGFTELQALRLTVGNFN